MLEPGHSSSTSGVAGPGPKSSPTSQHPRSMSLPRRPALILRKEGEGHGHSHSGPHMWFSKAKNQHGYSYAYSNCKRQYFQRWSEEEVDSTIQQRRCVVILDLSSSGADHVCLKKAGWVGAGREQVSQSCGARLKERAGWEQVSRALPALLKLKESRTGGRASQTC